MSEERLMTSAELAEMLQIARGTLDQWHHRGLGPKHIKVGRHRRYRREDVAAWLKTRERE